MRFTCTGYFYLNTTCNVDHFEILASSDINYFEHIQSVDGAASRPSSRRRSSTETKPRGVLSRLQSLWSLQRIPSWQVDRVMWQECPKAFIIIALVEGLRRWHHRSPPSFLVKSSLNLAVDLCSRRVFLSSLKTFSLCVCCAFSLLSSISPLSSPSASPLFSRNTLPRKQDR